MALPEIGEPHDPWTVVLQTRTAFKLVWENIGGNIANLNEIVLANSIDLDIFLVEVEGLAHLLKHAARLGLSGWEQLNDELELFGDMGVRFIIFSLVISVFIGVLEEEIDKGRTEVIVDFLLHYYGRVLDVVLVDDVGLLVEREILRGEDLVLFLDF